jgi:hypothetical protein
MPRRPEHLPIRRAVLSAADRQALAGAVMARTTGSACQRALVLIGAQPDGAFDAATSALLQGHLEHCTECRAVERTVAESRAVLATFTEIDPGAAFAAQVVAVTSAARPERSRRPAGRTERRPAWASAGHAGLADWWDRLLARPRLSLEIAYLATVLLVVIVGNPGLVADALSARIGGAPIVRVVSGAPGSAIAGPAAGVAEPSLVERIVREVEARQARVASGWTWLMERASQWMNASWNWIRNLFGVAEPLPAAGAVTEPATPPVRASR